MVLTWLEAQPFFVVNALQGLTVPVVILSRPLRVFEDSPLDRWRLLKDGTWEPPLFIVRFGYNGIRLGSSRAFVEAIEYLGSPPVYKSDQWTPLDAFAWYF